MTPTTLFDLLKDHQGKSLLFEYLPNQYVAPDYHITEVKHVTVDSVDCGSGLDYWTETVIQLYQSPVKSESPSYMSCYKALGILKKVGQLKPYDLNSTVKFEYSNSSFNTAQLFVNDFEIRDNNLILKLAIEKTDCKAKATCGIPEETSLVAEEQSCTPGSGCC